MATSLRIAYVLPGFCADEKDPCIPVITTFVREMAQRVETVIFTAEYPYRPGTYTLHNATVHCTGARPRNRLEKISGWQRAIARIEEEHRRRPFDLVHGFWGTTPGYAAVRGAKRIRRPSIISLAGGEFANFREAEYGAQRYRRSRWILGRTLDNAAVITSGSAWLAERAPEQYRQKLRTLPLGVDTALFSPGPLRTGHKLLAVAAMIPVKDYPTMLHAVSLARQRIPDLTLSIAGWHENRAELERVQRTIATLELEEAVAILGERNHTLMPDLYRSHDLLLHSSRYEAQGMAILEGLATGMPVISTSVGIAASLPESLVRRVAPEEWRNMGEKIVQSLTGTAHAEGVHTSAPGLIQKEFNAAVVAERFTALYEDIIHGAA